MGRVTLAVYPSIAPLSVVTAVIVFHWLWLVVRGLTPLLQFAPSVTPKHNAQISLALMRARAMLVLPGVASLAPTPTNVP